jgi:tetratricopeptide (TPR) repeat protein
VSYHKLDEKGLRRSIALYHSGLELDPDMGAAYAGIALAYCQLASMNYMPWTQVADSARVGAMRALSLNRNLAAAHVALGLIRYIDYERSAAEEEFKLALRLDPLYADCIDWYADLILDDGRFDDGIRLMKQAVGLEPLSAMLQYDLGAVLLNARHYDEGIRELQKVLDLDSTFFLADGQLSRGYCLKGQYDEAIDYAYRIGQKSDQGNQEQWFLAQICASMGRRDDARKCIRKICQMVGREVVDPGYIGMIYARLGERDSAFAWLEKAYRDHSNSMYFVKIIPEVDSLRSDKRYTELLRKAGYSE